MILGTVIDDFVKSWRLQRNYLWEFVLPDIGEVPGVLVSKYCQDVRFGDYSIVEVSQMRYGAFRAGYVGFLEINPVRAVFLKPVPDIVSVYFNAWRRLIVSDAGFFQVKSNYAKTAYVYLYDVDGSLSNSYKLVGVFPKIFFSYDDLSYGASDVVRFSIEFNVDRIVVES